jgi:cytochrome c553
MLLTAWLFVAVAYLGVAQAAGHIQPGKARAAACTGCHGASVEDKAGNPGLAGKSEDVLVQALKDYKSGKRRSAVMKSFANGLSDQDMENVAAYYASLKK